METIDHLGRCTTPAVLASVAAERPDQPFVVAEDGTLSYGQAATTVAAVAAGLRERGLRPGDRVGVMLPNGVRWCASTLGAHAAGLVVVPLNTWFKASELEGVVGRASLRLVVAEAKVFGQDVAAVLSALADRMTGFGGLLAWERGEDLPAGFRSGVADPLDVLRDAPVEEGHDAFILFTSGSSAAPKAVRLVHRGVLRTSFAVGERQGVRPGDRFWLPSPLFFVFGCGNALPNALGHGATLCVQERFEPGEALAFIERHRCTVYYGVGPVTQALAACPDLPHRDISSLRTGSANTTPEDLRLAIEVLGISQVCNAYGMTEGYGHSAMSDWRDPPASRRDGQGRVLPTQELRVLAVDGTVAEVGQVGAIWIRGEITPGYLDAPDLNATEFDHDGWFRTGDLGSIDAAGELHYVGRAHEMMKVKGINVSPAEVETALVQHKRVDQAFVFGLPLESGDTAIGCVLISTVPEDQRAGLAAEVVAWARDRIATYKVPHRVWVQTVAQIPLTATGKASKRLLSEQVSGIPEAYAR